MVKIKNNIGKTGFRKSGFTLIEVIIATSIITITVFWVYKLIWENTKIINKSWNILQSKYLFPLIEECIENLWIVSFPWWVWTKYTFNLWNNSLLNECKIGNSNILTIDNIDYILEWKVIDSWINYVELELSISSEEVKTMTWSYKLINK